MRSLSSPSNALPLLILSLVAGTTRAFTFDCQHIRISETSYDLSALGGPRSVLHSVDQGLSLHNTTYTVDLCGNLQRKDGVPKEHQCPVGTRVCGIERLLNKEEKTDTLERVVPIAGELKGKGGDSIDAKWSILDDTDSASTTSDPKKKVQNRGIMLELHGGFAGTGKEKRAQMAEITFLCDKDLSGLENLWTPEKGDEYVETRSGPSAARRRATDEDEGAEDPKAKPSLEFVTYATGSGDADVLKLRWRTKYACRSEQKELEKEKKSSSGWGFFTWFIVIAFMSTAAYLIFGSWLNYNRYGARGWDLLPHGDSLRDVPYLLRDWMRRVLNTVQGQDNRGGYAAV